MIKSYSAVSIVGVEDTLSLNMVIWAELKVKVLYQQQMSEQFGQLSSCFSFLSVYVCICPDENGKEQGINVRQKVKEMVEFVQDDDRLREERKKAKKNKDKYIGVSSDSMGGGGSIKNCK